MGESIRAKLVEHGWIWIAVVAVGVALALQVPRYPNHDVAFLTWLANFVMGPGQFGVEVLELNPPLSFIIYIPAAAVSHLVGYDWAIKGWISIIFIFSIAMAWQASPREYRIPVCVTLGLFFALAFPREFGQREQISLLLCAPYVTGHMKRRWLGVLSGLMAGVGFALKPHFLVALVLVFLIHRKVRTEEWVIAATGTAYAFALVLFFRPYLFEVMPLASSTYWGVSAALGSERRIIELGALLSLGFIGWCSDRKPLVLRFLAAGVGFAIAAGLQNKFFPYHFVPGWGFLMLAIAAQAAEGSKFSRYSAFALLGFGLVPLYLTTMVWLDSSRIRSIEIKSLVRAIDGSRSFTVFAVHPYPAFPSALYTSSSYVGFSNSHWVLPAVAKGITGQSDEPTDVAKYWAVQQALIELRRSPEIVVVDPDWRRHTGLRSEAFDGLDWLRNDAEFDALWREYEPVGSAGRFLLYRRTEYSSSYH